MGAVVGATWPQQLKSLRKRMPHTCFLVPGYGAQGGGAKDVANAFDKEGLGAIINASRSLMCAYKSKKDQDKYTENEFDLPARSNKYARRTVQYFALISKKCQVLIQLFSHYRHNQ